MECSPNYTPQEDSSHLILAYEITQFRRVLRCPTGIDRGCQVISGFRRHLELTDILGLDLMLVSIRCQIRYEFQKYEVMTMSVVGGRPKKNNTHINNTHRTHFSNL